jgi:hypothetical protein
VSQTVGVVGTWPKPYSVDDAKRSSQALGMSAPGVAIGLSTCAPLTLAAAPRFGMVGVATTKVYARAQLRAGICCTLGRICAARDLRSWRHDSQPSVPLYCYWSFCIAVGRIDLRCGAGPLRESIHPEMQASDITPHWPRCEHGCWLLLLDSCAAWGPSVGHCTRLGLSDMRFNKQGEQAGVLLISDHLCMAFKCTCHGLARNSQHAQAHKKDAGRSSAQAP